jgi:hypothetical protein
MHNIIDGAAMIVSPVKSVKQIVDGISDGLGIVAKKGDVNTHVDAPSIQQNKLSDRYSQNTDGTITGPKGGQATPTGVHDIETKAEINKRDSGGHYVDADGKQQSVKSPSSGDSKINEQKEHHQVVVDKVEQGLKNDGREVVTDGRIYNADGSGSYCKPDICATGGGKAPEIIEIKTGNADLSNRQREGFEKTGTNVNGEPTYRIPPDATVTGEIAKQLEIPSGGKVGSIYPEGIPVTIDRYPGIKEK